LPPPRFFGRKEKRTRKTTSPRRAKRQPERWGGGAGARVAILVRHDSDMRLLRHLPFPRPPIICASARDRCRWAYRRRFSAARRGALRSSSSSEVSFSATCRPESACAYAARLFKPLIAEEDFVPDCQTRRRETPETAARLPAKRRMPPSAAAVHARLRCALTRSARRSRQMPQASSPSPFLPPPMLPSPRAPALPDRTDMPARFAPIHYATYISH